MDTIDWVNLSLAVLSVGASIWAVLRAESAKRAVNKFIHRRRVQSALPELKEILEHLRSANTAAMGRKAAPKVASRGRNEAKDINALDIVQNALATVSISYDLEFEKTLRDAARKLESGIGKIRNPRVTDNAEGWRLVRETLQYIIPELNKFYEKLGYDVLK